MSEKLIIYTDGACKGNPGLGGWGAVLIYGEHRKEIYGSIDNTTNNRMELMAVIEAIKVIKRPCPIEIYTDSQYVHKGISEWIHGWIKKNWKNVKNIDLWQELLLVQKGYEISWNWVRGHDGNELNERADQLANLAVSQHGN